MRLYNIQRKPADEGGGVIFETETTEEELQVLLNYAVISLMKLGLLVVPPELKDANEVQMDYLQGLNSEDLPQA